MKFVKNLILLTYSLIFINCTSCNYSDKKIRVYSIPDKICVHPGDRFVLGLIVDNFSKNKIKNIAVEVQLPNGITKFNYYNLEEVKIFTGLNYYENFGTVYPGKIPPYFLYLITSPNLKPGQTLKIKIKRKLFESETDNNEFFIPIEIK